ncbi:hypothetical protein L1987_75525 [Smallanthus sonchifolius]|uniref:Uncharacterized protein n=1 Tax=Smallanthus sonchifolius TaxID=185202 RepID=A0ACB9A5S3_9ASTR|nr:hypothetical protein L1987_75525 [Smallanthus sonchifolius]
MENQLRTLAVNPKVFNHGSRNLFRVFIEDLTLLETIPSSLGNCKKLIREKESKRWSKRDMITAQLELKEPLDDEHKKSTDLMFGEGLNLHNYAKKAMGDSALEIVDPVLLKDDRMIGLRTNEDETIGYMNRETCLRLLLEL